ncbi:MAG: UDP-glucose 4-epimerase GalE [Aquiluna sp.]|nr:UDP-glucose 4-epimerase GalE [Aquiluna sp.]
MKLLVTGGAGYIGSHVVRLAEAAGAEITVVDDLSTGITSRITCPLEQIELSQDLAIEQLTKLMSDTKFDAVIHLAARKQVGQSVEQPERYYKDNVGGLANLLTAMRATDTKKIVFSSSAATYGMPDVETVSEDYSGTPINPYGETKLVGEWLVRAAAVWGLRSVNLRYFNVAGTGFADLADTAALNLIPIAIGQIRSGKNPIVFGDDYQTPDGSCIRDYVHVHDLAAAHIRAVEYLDSEDRPFDTFNVGTGVGASVFEVLSALKSASGIDFEIEVGSRRAGDPPRLVADVSRIEKVLGFRCDKGLAEIVQSAWDAS